MNNALIQDPTILSKSIDAQLRYLITKPLQEVTRHSPPSAAFHTPTVIIDGLDECEGHGFQRVILNAISAAVFKEHTPLRFLIASRPEPQISETFHTQPLAQHRGVADETPVAYPKIDLAAKFRKRKAADKRVSGVLSSGASDGAIQATPLGIPLSKSFTPFA